MGPVGLEIIQTKQACYKKPKMEETVEALSEEIYNHFTAGLEALKKAFDLFDLDKDGYITAEETMKATRDLSKKDADEFVKLADENGDRKVDFNEFRNTFVKSIIL